MAPGQNVIKILVMAFIILCSLMAGTVWAGQTLQLSPGVAGYGTELNRSACAFGNTCGDITTRISLGTTGFHFAATPTSGQAPLQVQFSAASGPEIVTYSWDFGDGSYGSGINPVHTYTTPGTYTVKLTVRQSGQAIDPESAYFSCGSTSTWQKDAMIQVTGTTINGDQGSSGSKGATISNDGVIQAENNARPVLSIQYPAASVHKIKPLDYPRGKLTQRSAVMTSWKTSAVKNGK
jgi:hypothetical protein